MTRKIAVGRIVRYVDPHAETEDAKLLAALIVNVVNEEAGIVNLTVFHAEGGTGFVRAANFAKADEAKGDTWHWPPRQKPPKKKPKPTT